jgi:hypothetical protein
MRAQGGVREIFNCFPCSLSRAASKLCAHSFTFTTMFFDSLRLVKTAPLNPRDESHHGSLITFSCTSGLLKYLSLLKLKHGNRITALLFIVRLCFWLRQ